MAFNKFLYHKSFRSRSDWVNNSPASYVVYLLGERGWRHQLFSCIQCPPPPTSTIESQIASLFQRTHYKRSAKRLTSYQIGTLIGLIEKHPYTHVHNVGKGAEISQTYFFVYVYTISRVAAYAAPYPGFRYACISRFAWDDGDGPVQTRRDAKRVIEIVFKGAKFQKGIH